ncbi:MAG TPA: M50 family metallopeptidase [Solirubrobacterales bacterium]|jgi:regulator of sigma E protease|nr:M50 family metallopeptidase [Solirubrobacterales bacterium]
MSWFLAFAGFAALIILHEFGHFIAAKWTGMRVERFFLFFPPKLWSIRRGETEYGIGAIPLGGFVKITGMNPDEVEPRDAAAPPREAGLLEKVESVDQDPGEGVSRPGEPLPPGLRERAYYNQPVWKRIVVIGAGPAMNVLIAFLIFFFLAFGINEVTGPGLRIAELTSESPARGQLHEDDRIVSIDGRSLESVNGDERADRFRELIGSHTCAGEPASGCEATTPVRVVVERDGGTIPLEITPRYDTEAGQALLGVRFEPTDVSPANPSIAEAADFSVDQMWTITSQTASVIARIFDAEQRKEISGVVGSYEATRQAINFDAWAAFFLLGAISLSLAIVNLFPFLPLDGGHIFWSIVEKVRGRRVSFRTMERAGAVGFVLILALAYIGLSNDIGRLTGEGIDIQR